MRRATITDMDGNELGAIIEEDGGTLIGEGKGQPLIEQAPGKTYEDWIETTHHSKYLRLVEQAEASA